MATLIQLLVEVVAPLGFVALVLLYFLLNPEKVEIWASILWRLLARFPVLVKKAKRRYVQYDLQGRINDFTKVVLTEAPYLEHRRVDVEWVNPGELRKPAFLADGRVILRLHATDNNDENFVRGSYLYISTCLLHKAKRYISKVQREAIDLYVTGKLLEKEKSHIVNYFLDEYLHPRTTKEDSKLVELFDAFGRLQMSGLFYEIFIQELQFLGEKVFGGRKDPVIHEEVGNLILFLDKIANRNIGEEVPLEFTGTYCRFSIVMVGKSFNLTTGGEVWTRFIETHVTPSQIETLYLIGNWQVHDVMDAISASVAATYEVMRTIKRQVQIFRDGDPMSVENYLLVLRRQGISVFGPSIQKR